MVNKLLENIYSLGYMWLLIGFVWLLVIIFIYNIWYYSLENVNLNPKIEMIFFIGMIVISIGITWDAIKKDKEDAKLTS